jgi:GNAT superfamily N-acetyltransferase
MVCVTTPFRARLSTTSTVPHTRAMPHTLTQGMTHPDSTGRAILYRYLSADDDVDDITAMLHEAYAPLAAAGMRFVASHQDSATTRRRLDRGVTLSRTDATRGTPFYEKPDVASFGQFAVRPSHQRRGIGRTLLGLVEQRARELGVRHLALDTSEHATNLITFYKSLGFHILGHHRWDTVNYRSVVMAKDLTTPASSQ